MNVSYIAGFFDGEGCIYKSPKTARSNESRAITIVQAHPREGVLYAIRDYITEQGIQCHVRHSRKADSRVQDCYTLAIGARHSVIAFLELLLPHLIAKREAALEAIIYCGAISTRIGRHPESQLEYAYKLYTTGIFMTNIRKLTGVCAASLHSYIRKKGLQLLTQKERWELLPYSQQTEIRRKSLKNIALAQDRMQEIRNTRRQSR